jgi:bacteriocin-like protein
MSKSNDSPKLRTEDVETLDLGVAATVTVCELRDDELQSVSGGHSRFGVKDQQVNSIVIHA